MHYLCKLCSETETKTTTVTKETNMRTQLLTTIITLTTALTAQASFMSDVCSNAKATIITKSGHMTPVVTVHEYSISDGAYLPISLDAYEIKTESLNENTLSTKTTDGCVEGQRYGYGSSDTIYSKEIILSNKDGSTFPEGISGRSEDGLTIRDHVICESHISWRTFCEQN